MVGHFTPMGINSSDLFQVIFLSTTNGGLFQVIFFWATNGGSLQVIFFSLQWGVTSKDFSFPWVLFLHFFSS
jgi:hypothetical protein